MPVLRVTSVSSCACAAGEHAQVLLREAGGAGGVKVRVSAAAGRAILAKLNGIETPCSEALALFHRTLRALEAEPESVLLACTDQTVRAHLRLRTARTALEIAADASQALLVACCLDLPILAGMPAQDGGADTDIPAVYRPLLDALDLGGLDPPEPWG
jgi:hypothetical protein